METASFSATRVLFLPDDGPQLDGEAAALDAIGAAFSAEAGLVAIPLARLPEEFFDLSTRIAGDVLQKFANYRLRVAILGGIEQHLARSGALRDFVAESNRGRQVWFLPDRATLAATLP